MFNGYSGVWAEFPEPLNEYKSIVATRVVMDLYESDPQRGLYGGGGIDARAVGNSTSLPLESNTITLNPDLKDPWGRPAMWDGSSLVTGGRGQAHHDHSGARIPRGRPHRLSGPSRRDLGPEKQRGAGRSTWPTPRKTCSSSRCY